MAQAFFRNLRYAARSLRKSPAFTVSVILTLALAIGANSAVFSALDAVLLRPLPFPDADRLVKLGQLHPRTPQSPFVAPVRLEDWNRFSQTFTAISGYYAQDDSELSGDLPEKLKHAYVASRFFQVWGVAPALGREFTPAEERSAGPNAVVISDRLWRRRFAADPGVLGRTLRLGRASFPIVGVMPPSFLFPDRDVDLWSPSPGDAPFAQSRSLTWYNAVGRMKPGVTFEQARADLARVQANLGRQFPATDAQLSVTLEPLQEATVGGVRRSLWLLFGSVTLLLVIACINIAALLLSRAAGRRREIAVRFSLGASRGSVAAQLLSEVLLLALAGAGLGLLLAAAAARAFRALARDLPRIDEIALDWRLVLYALGCAMAVTLVCGLVPALHASRRESAWLAQAGRAQVSGRHPLRWLLVGVQIALAVMLLAGAGLLVRSFEALGRVSPGFDAGHVLAFHISSSWAETYDYWIAQHRTARLLDGLRTVPGVESAATTLGLPGVPAKYTVEFRTAEGRAATEPKMLAHESVISPEYFAALRIPLVAGELCRSDARLTGVMVNRRFADSYLGGARAIGLHLTDPDNPFFKPAEIRGIVGDARETGLDHDPVPTVYWCSEATQPGTYFLVRTHGDPAVAAQSVRRKMFELEPRRSVYDLAPLAGRISEGYAQNRLRTVLLAFFALTAIALASVGLYGTLAYLVSLRRREIGLRLAIGAMRGRIVRQFVWEGLRVCAAGAAVGLALAAAFTRALAGMLYGVSPTDAATLGAVVAGVMAVGLLACLVPAIRAARLDPIQVLRED
jgi:putative ABC transport system permease protein